MFDRTAPTARKSASTLDRAVVASVAAMLGFNLIVFTQQFQTNPQASLAANTAVEVRA